jgi:hypothetical protein
LRRCVATRRARSDARLLARSFALVLVRVWKRQRWRCGSVLGVEKSAGFPELLRFARGVVRYMRVRIRKGKTERVRATNHGRLKMLEKLPKDKLEKFLNGPRFF